MLKNQCTTLLCLAFLCICLPAESQSCKKKYKSKIEENSKLLSCGYNYSIEKTDRETYIYKRYYPDTKAVTLFATAKDKKIKELHGLYKELWDDGTIVKQGFYVNNVKQGEWLENRNEKGKYKDGKREGLWIRLEKDSLLAQKSFYTDGLLNGKKIYYDSLGQEKYTEIYDAGVLITTDFDSSTVKEMPRFPGCEEKETTVQDIEKCSKEQLLIFIYKQLRYPAVARENGVQGMALVQFDILADGSVTNLQIRNGLCKQIKEEIESIFERMPQWRPGMDNGKAVKVQYTMPIKFRLE